MLALIVILPLAAFVAILLGAPARLTAIAASAVNLVLGIIAAFTWRNSPDTWSWSMPVLDKPALNLSFGFTPDGMSAVMILLSGMQMAGQVISRHDSAESTIAEPAPGGVWTDLPPAPIPPAFPHGG